MPFGHVAPMRVVLASSSAEDFALLHETCELAGHTPLAYAYSRSMRPGQPADAYAVRMVTGVVGALPSGVDLLLPAGPEGLHDALVGYRPDLLVIYGFNWILPPPVFRLPRNGTVNVHPSLLPRHRGAAPVLWAIRNGDPEIGVTAHRVDEGLDTGPILAQRGGVRIDGDITPERLRTRLAPVLRAVLTAALAGVASGAPGRPQPADGASRAPLMTPERRRLDWSLPAREVHNRVRLLRFMGKDEELAAQVGDRWLRVLRTSLAPADGVRAECTDGPIWIVESVPAGPPVTGPPGSG
jgi:methionyl-tRNA formyltransferase